MKAIMRVCDVVLVCVLLITSVCVYIHQTSPFEQLSTEAKKAVLFEMALMPSRNN